MTMSFHHNLSYNELQETSGLQSPFTLMLSCREDNLRARVIVRWLTKSLDQYSDLEP